MKFLQLTAVDNTALLVSVSAIAAVVTQPGGTLVCLQGAGSLERVGVLNTPEEIAEMLDGARIGLIEVA